MTAPARYSVDAALAEFPPAELRELALDLGLEPTLQEQILREAGEMRETEFLAAFVCGVFEDLHVQQVSVADWVRLVSDRRSGPSVVPSPTDR